MAVKYFNSDKELAKLLLINRESNAKLRMPVYKRALLYSEPERLTKKRIGIWRFVLNLNRNTRDY